MPATSRSSPRTPEKEGGEALGQLLWNAANQGDGAAVAGLLAVGADPNALVTGHQRSGASGVNSMCRTTMLLAVAISVWGLQSVRLPKMERFNEAIAGGTITMCGLSIVVLGL